MQKNYKVTLFNRVYHVRLNEAESHEFKRIAEKLKTTRAALLRLIIREVIGEGPSFLPHELGLMSEAISQVGGSARNLNQLVRGIHTGKVTAIQDHILTIEAVRNSVESLRSTLHEVVDRSHQRWVKVDGKKDQKLENKNVIGD